MTWLRCVLSGRRTPGCTYAPLAGRRQVSTRAGSVWTLGEGNDQFEALLPLDSGLADYALRMGELLQTLALAEGRSQTAVYRDLLTTLSDVIRIRIADPDLCDGTLPIEQHAQIAYKARDLMLAAACAALETRPVWHTRKPEQAAEHVRGIRIGQSEQGSYVLTVINRVPPELRKHDGQLFEPKPPYERQVTQTLAGALRALRSATETAALTQEMTAFDTAVTQGVTANLCEAVAGLWGGDESQRRLEFSFSWSPARPEPPETPRKIKFAADCVSILREAGRQMRERAPVPEFEVAGAVVKLDRPEGAAIGKVTIASMIDGRHARITVELPEAAYHDAVKAPRSGNITAAVWNAGQGRPWVQITDTIGRRSRGILIVTGGCQAAWKLDDRELCDVLRGRGHLTQDETVRCHRQPMADDSRAGVGQRAAGTARPARCRGRRRLRLARRPERRSDFGTGWSPLNKERAAEEARGQVRWLRPEFQNPSGPAKTQKSLVAETDGEPTKPGKAAKVPKRDWPASLSGRFQAVRGALLDGPPSSPAMLAKRFKNARVEGRGRTAGNPGNARPSPPPRQRPLRRVGAAAGDGLPSAGD